MKLVTSLQINLITPNKNLCSQNMHLWRSKNRRCTIQVKRNFCTSLSFPTYTHTLSWMDGEEFPEEPTEKLFHDF